MCNPRVYTDDQLQAFVAAPVMIPKIPDHDQAGRAAVVVVIWEEGGS